MIKRKREQSPQSQLSRKDKLKSINKNTYNSLGNTNYLEKNFREEPFYNPYENKKPKSTFRNNTFIDGRQSQHFDSRNKSYFNNKSQYKKSEYVR